MQALSPTDALRRNSFFNYGESAMTCRHALDAILPTDLRKYVPLLHKCLSGLQLPDPSDDEHCAGLPSGQVKSLMQRMLSRVIEAASAERPVLCLLDSCHTLDDTSWSLLDSLEQMRKSSEYHGHGISVCIVTRPLHHTSIKYARYQMNLKRAQQNGTFLELGPLVGDDFHKYLHQLLNMSDDYPVPAKLTQYVQEKSQGNPFFVAELLQVSTVSLPHAPVIA